MYFVYVLKSEKDNYLYIGITNNLNKRLKQHNDGSNFSTKHRRPFKLVYFEIKENRQKAREREKFLKSGCGREYIKKLIKQY
ncbi:MAG: GIY-YIG nuclease family protein [Candidatus Azambacteria bacterium]|nr:GIY-YIG nuclease family protein [Candidatus Azambacteria bacterium]